MCKFQAARKTMENIGKIRKITYLLAALFAANLILIAFMMPSLTLWTVSALVVQVIVGIYFTGIIIALLRELDGKDKEKK